MENVGNKDNCLGIFQEQAVAFFRPASEDDINLVEHMRYLLTEYVGEFAAHCFMSDPNIISVMNLKTNAQLVTINRYLSSLFLMYRGAGGNRVDLVMAYLSNDGLIEDYISVQKHIVLPFIKDNHIFETMYSKGE